MARRAGDPARRVLEMPPGVTTDMVAAGAIATDPRASTDETAIKMVRESGHRPRRARAAATVI